MYNIKNEKTFKALYILILFFEILINIKSFNIYSKQLFVFLYKSICGSMLIVVVSAIFCGAVLTIYGRTETMLYIQKIFHTNKILATMVSSSIMREVCPVLIGSILTTKIVSDITSKISIMKVTDQINTLTIIGINPVAYLATPMFIGCIITFPVLLLVTYIISIISSIFVATHILNIDQQNYTEELFMSIDMNLIKLGFVKSFAFSLVTGFSGIYHGFNINSSTIDVSTAVNKSIVTSLLLILIFNYFITSIFI